MKGKIFFYSRAKGYGFIRTDWQDLVFYQSNILSNEWLRPGTKVEFEVVSGDNGKDKAIWLRKKERGAYDHKR